ncbi:hypothetical protein M409DRAFT_36484 [Zasmidium cellare ATCC 36951]|uniref:Major facilitator superfamily (MFS) profile domain-containing protein n=1 Tax=Zasmidium cellare ATCC 36951 TaxID=1080233 RepID=A0A6A6CKJ7_ZASCE|nr:uncharacterized protein M409DRAFT_36484 [Zasmidium cellare ATCC 36951]KAF2167675.1 hypothetical protein M409DRAFT_36484 [Zasmidium cellare ATCC 36951]
MSPGPDLDTEPNANPASDDNDSSIGDEDNGASVVLPPYTPPYSSFEGRTRAAIMIAACSSSAVSPFSTSIYYPAVPALSQKLGVPVTLINLTISSYQIFQGIAPSFTAAFSESYGRRPAYLLGFVVWLGANLGLALQNEYAALLVLRCLQSCGSSGSLALAAAVCADLAPRSERGKYTGYTTIGVVFGSSIAPVVGGLLSYYLGPQSIFWFLVIFSGILCVVVAVVFPETCRSVVGNGSVPPQRRNRSLIQLTRPSPGPGDIETVSKKKRRLNPLTALFLLRDLENFLLALYVGILYSGSASVTRVLASQLARRYHFNEIQTGLCYIPLGVGAMTSRWTMANLIDWRFKREAGKQGLGVEKNRRQDISKFNIEMARLPLCLPVVFASCCCFITYGWVMEYHTPLAVIIVVLFLMGNITTSPMIPMATLMVDLNPDNTASASASLNLVRMLMSAGFVAVYTPLIDAIGIGWTCTMTAGIFVLFAPCVLVVMSYGYSWRLRKAEKETSETGSTNGREASGKV